MNNQLEFWQKLSYHGLMLLLVFTPIFRGGNRPLPLLLIELLSLCLLLTILWNPKRAMRIPPVLVGMGLAMLLLPILYLLPLPESLVNSFPGRAIYAEVLDSVNAGGWQGISIIPSLTESAIYATIPLVAVFAAVYLLPVPQVKTLVLILIGVASLQAVLGLMQYGAGPTSALHFGNPFASKSATGTFANRDHLAGMLEMVFPMVLALMASTLGQGGMKSHRQRARWRQKIAFFSSVKGHQAALFGALGVLLLLGLVFTQSRAGVALAMLGLFLSLLAFARRLGGTNVYGTLGSVMAVALVVAVEVGLAPVLDRFSMDPLQDNRWPMFASVLDGIGNFFPLGGGAGVFPAVYPVFQPADLGHGLLNHAHNDYLEALFEQGVFSLIIILVGGFLYLRQWPRLWIGSHWGNFRFIQVGAGIGLLLMLLHSLLDFNLRIPANAIVFAFLAAVFFKEYKEQSRRKKSGAQARREQREEPASATAVAVTAASETEEENPFLR